MTIKVALTHKTHYKFDRAIKIYPHTIRLRPAPHCRTPILSYSLNIEPKNHYINWQQDPFGNYLARLVFPEKTNFLSLDVELIADLIVINPFDFFLDENCRHFPFTYSEQLRKELSPYLQKLPLTPLFAEYLSSIPLTRATTNDFLVSVNQALQKIISYTIRLEVGIQTPEETLSNGKGSCRDTAWLLIQLLRHLGLAARFTSGYLVQLKPDEKPIDGPVGAKEDFTDLHAWCEVYLPGAGWVGMDPTSGLFVSEGHIPLACTPDPVSAAPITGETEVTDVDFSFSNEVRRLHEDPRVTKPYTEEQWQAVLTLGNSVDERLNEEDVRLTMGGEPTFVSIDDMESDEWNTEALGEHKLERAIDLLVRLKKRFAPDGIMQLSQGKWYPNEVLPRWAMGITWRKDKIPLWDQPALLDTLEGKGASTIATAKHLIMDIAELLGLAPTFCQSAFEDVMFYQHQIDKLPEAIDLTQPTKHQAEQYVDLIRFIQQDNSQPACYILPVAWHDKYKGWQSSIWPFEPNNILLTPGDSPACLRLPLDTIPEEKQEILPEPDPFAEKKPLSRSPKDALPLPSIEKSESTTVIKHCLGTRIVDGKLYVFIPPMDNVEQFIQLMAVIETAAEKQQTPIVLEGYQSPADPRINKLFITPDPGVIEVNIPPSERFREIKDITLALYQEARDARLATEKFMLDGRHTGTGGGNHITLGAMTPKDSPLLRRPDLLQSLVSYWQNHPSLSYLFSGAFIGPTSQAPRADEGRDEMLYELELAFSQVPKGETLKPWLVDRLFRNLLVDITGNTHRAEFCIDKLYSPTGVAGRLGILEFRGFEMPPHSRMSLVQILLIRSLVAYFWKTPYTKPLVRFGTALHDQYMLPHYVFEDIKTVVQDLNDQGLNFQLDWLLPFEEFRFPYYGRVQIGDIQIELRFAIEPWHVLGEEVTHLGSSRYVDSSVERVQVKVYGLIDNRYVLCCNHRRVPLTQTGINGVYVAGVRYRAWHPPSGLHPTIEKNTPLIFDLIDTWNNQVIGGCSYDVSHPGGRTYDTFPLNAFEAESRRYNRFSTTNHSQQPTKVPPDIEPNPDYPHTLDLRQPLRNQH